MPGFHRSIKWGGNGKTGPSYLFLNRGSVPRKELVSADGSGTRKEVSRIAIWCIERHYNVSKFRLFLKTERFMRSEWWMFSNPLPGFGFYHLRGGNQAPWEMKG
jgi:hypothetical protein